MDLCRKFPSGKMQIHSLSLAEAKEEKEEEARGGKANLRREL